MMAGAPRVGGSDVSRTLSTSAAGLDSLPPPPEEPLAGSGRDKRRGRVRSRGSRLAPPQPSGPPSAASVPPPPGATRTRLSARARLKGGGLLGWAGGLASVRCACASARARCGDLGPKAVRQSGKVALGPDGAAAGATLVPAPRLRRTGPVRTESSQCSGHRSQRSRGARPLFSQRRTWAGAPASRFPTELVGRLLQECCALQASTGSRDHSGVGRGSGPPKRAVHLPLPQVRRSPRGRRGGLGALGEPSGAGVGWGGSHPGVQGPPCHSLACGTAVHTCLSAEGGGTAVGSAG